ncbi:MAG: DNA polymerase IV [Sporolactobacillus sp.]
MSRVIFLIDMECFYASCEKRLHPETDGRPLLVAADPRQSSGIVLAACPLAKSRGVSTADRLAQALAKCPDAIVCRPHMQYYIDVSLAILRIVGTFTDLVEPYSIDELFADVTGSLHRNQSAESLAKTIQHRIGEHTSIYARIGIGSNKVLAKMACDQFSKKNQSGLFTLDDTNLQQRLWPLPVAALFGVGKQMDRHLRGMGIRNVGQLAHYPLDLLRRRWGINGELLQRTACGLDSAPVSAASFLTHKTIGHHITLPHNYETPRDIGIVLLELCGEVAERARDERVRGSTVSVSLSGRLSHRTGFRGQQKLSFSTNYDMDIYRAALPLIHKRWDGMPVRGLSVTLSDLSPADCYQLDWFEAPEYKEQLTGAIDRIRRAYGQKSLCRSMSLLPASQFAVRAEKIGGHFK